LDLKTFALTLLALVAFASNSLLTRLALASGEIDGATFTFLRLASGAIVLALVVRAQSGAFGSLRGGGLIGPLALSATRLPFPSRTSESALLSEHWFFSESFSSPWSDTA
jgi:hypothetical protein